MNIGEMVKCVFNTSSPIKTLLLFVMLLWPLANLKAEYYPSPTPPDLNVCEGVKCRDLPIQSCTDGGYKVKLLDFMPGHKSDYGMATYVYEFCSPPPGVCEGGKGLRYGESCLDNEFCQSKHYKKDPYAYCNRKCAVDDFKPPNHFDVLFPDLDDKYSCLSGKTEVYGSCKCKEGSSYHCSIDRDIKLGDGACFDGKDSKSFVAKCNNASLKPGDCVVMDLNIAGETHGLGLNSTVVVDKDAYQCNSTCLAGPSCDACDKPPYSKDKCLTRSKGFWGNHPWITNDFVPVTVCGQPLGCDDSSKDSTCSALKCDSVIEGLCSKPPELKDGYKKGSFNNAYVNMVAQLTAAKLNLNATSELFYGAKCSDFVYKRKSIQEWIYKCESLCGADKKTINRSGCIDALTAFNESEDVGFKKTPEPFDRPSINDKGEVEGADPSQCNIAKGTPGHGDVKLVIGKDTKDNKCSLR